jgi:dATP/dGTP diphosphohydrolase, N-terminal
MKKSSKKGPGVAKVRPGRYFFEALTREAQRQLLMNQEDADALGVQYEREVPPFMSTDSAVRKRMPVASGVLAYFPDALLCVAWISKVGNDKHNPGQPLHWAKEKSTDEPDCEVRHMLDYFRGLEADPGLEPLGELGHLASKAWRALAHLQRECDAERAKRGAR